MGLVKMSLNKKNTKQPGEKRRRRERLLNQDETLEEFILRLNSSNPPNCVKKDADLTKCKKNPEFLAEYLYKPFKIQQLVKNNIETHYGSCDVCTAKNEREEFIQIGRPDCHIKASVLAKHAFRNHGRKEGLPITRKRKAEPNSQPAKKLKLCTPTQKSLDAISNQNLRLLSSGQIKALNTFEDKEFINRDRMVLEAFGIDPSGADLLSKSRFTTRRAIFDKTEANRKMIGEQIPTIAKNFGGVGWSFDHKVGSLY